MNSTKLPEFEFGYNTITSFSFTTVFTTEIEFDYNTISSRIRELAFLNPEVDIIFHICSWLWIY